MTSDRVELLRCLWADDGGGRHDGRLDLIGEATSGVMVCRDCSARYLMADGIPHMLSEAQLSAAERRELHRLCRRWKVS